MEILNFILEAKYHSLHIAEFIIFYVISYEFIEAGNVKRNISNIFIYCSRAES